MANSSSGRRAATRKPRLIVGVGAATLAGLLIGSAGYALWNAEQSMAASPFTAGDLNLTGGSGTWLQVTPGVPVSQRAGGAMDAEADFATMPGDVIEFRMPITTTLQGENLEAQLLVSTSGGAAESLESGGIVATYRVEDAGGSQAAPIDGEAELGEPVSIDGLISSNEGVAAQWQVVVTVKVLDNYTWINPDEQFDVKDWTVDQILMDLQQVRGNS